MRRPQTKGAEEARAQLPRLLQEAENGLPTVITRHGRSVAVLVRPQDLPVRQQSLLAAEGTGKGLWGPDSREAIRGLRDEWR